MQEIELKFLDINVELIKNKLKEIGAKLKYDTYIEWYTFIKKWFSSWTKDKYLRVRKINQKVEITFKWKVDKNSKMTSREEVEYISDNYENSILLFEKLWFKKSSPFKKHRIHFELWNIHFELDTKWKIPTYLEIETKTENDMIDICKKIWLDIKDWKKWTIVEILPEYFS